MAATLSWPFQSPVRGEPTGAVEVDDAGPVPAAPGTAVAGEPVAGDAGAVGAGVAGGGRVLVNRSIKAFARRILER